MALLRSKLTGLVAILVAVMGVAAFGQTVDQPGFVSLSDGALYDSSYVDYGSAYGVAPIGPVGGFLWLQGDFGERPGSTDNFWQVGTFLPGPAWGDGFLFADVLGMGNDEGEIGTDVNFGYRWLMEEAVLGAYVGYTHDTSANGYQYNQYSFGAEFMMSHLLISGNAYLPFNNDINAVGRSIPTLNTLFQGMQVGFLDDQPAEQQMRGLDLTATAWVPNHEWLFGGVGVYHYDAEDGDNTTGVRGRVGLDFNVAQLDLAVTNDDLFGTTANLGVAWMLGRGEFGLGKSGFANPLDRRAYDRLYKQRRIAVDDVMSTVFTPSINPRTGQPYVIKHVSNNGPANGDGSFESPWNRLDLANQSGADAILVYQSGTTPLNRLPAGDGLQLENYQRLLGEGVPHFFTDDMRGTFLFPFISPVGEGPYVGGNPGSTIVRLASNNEVNGLNFISPDNGVAIGGQGARNFAILNINKDIGLPNLTGAGSGIVLRDAAGFGLIQNVAFNIPNLTAMGGIRIANSDSDPLTLDIDGVRFLQGGQAGLGLYASNAIISATATNVFAANNSNGLLMDAHNGGRVDLAVTGSTFNDAVNGLGAGRGISVRGTTDGRLNLVATNTSAGGADINGLLVHLQSGSDANVSVTGGNFSAAGSDGVSVNVNDATLDLMLASTLVNGVGRDAVKVIASNLGDVNIGLANSSFDGAAQDAFDLSLTGGASVDLAGRMVNATSAFRSSLVFDLDEGSLLNVGFTQSDLSAAFLGDGIQGTLNDASTAMLAFVGTNVTNVGGDAIDVFADNGSLFDGSFSNGSISDANGNAVIIDLDNGSGARLAMSNMTANQAGGYGLSVFADNGSLFDVNLASTTFHDSGMTAIQAIANNGSTGVITGTAVGGANAGGDGIELRSSGGQLTADFINTGSFVNAAGNGVNIVADMGGSIDANIAGNGVAANFANAGIDGVNIDLNDASALLSLTNANFSNAAKHGFDINAMNGSSFIATTTNVDFSGAGMNAFNINSDPGSTVIVDGNNVSGGNTAMNAINVVADGAVVDVDIANADFFANAGINSIFIHALNGGTANVNVAGMMGTPADFTGAAGDAVQVLQTDGSTVNLSLSNIDFGNAGGNGLLVDVTDSFFNGSVFDSDFSDAALNAVAVLSDSSLVNLGLTETLMDNAGLDGLHVEENLSTVNVSIIDSSVTGAGDDAFDIGYNRDVNLFVDPTMATGAGNNGFEFVGTGGGSLMATFLDSSLANAGMNGIIGVLDGGSSATLNFTNTAVTGAGLNGAQILANNGSTFNGTFNNSAFDNAATGNGFGITLQNGSIGNVILDGSSANNVGTNGFFANVRNGSRLTARLNNGTTFNSAGADAIQIIAATNAMATVTSNTGVGGSMAGDNGIDIDATGGSTVDVSLANAGSFNNATNAGVDVSNENSTVNLGISGGSFNSSTAGDGLLFTLSNGADSALTLSGTSAITAFGDGLDVDATGGSTMNAIVSGANFSGAGNNGIELNFDNSTGQFAFSNTNFSNAIADNIDLDASGGAMLNVGITGGSNTGAGDNAFEIDFSGGSTVNLAVTGTPSTGANGDGLDFDGQTGGTLNLTLANSNLSTAADAVGGDGVFGTLNAASANLNLSNISIANAGADAIDIELAAGSTLAATLNTLNMNMAGDNGLELSTNASNATVALNNSTINSATTDGINVNAAAGSNVMINKSTTTVMGAGDDAVDINNVASLVTVIDPGDLSGAADNAYEFNVDDGGVLNVTILDTPLSTAANPVGNHVIFGTLDNASTANFNVAGSNMSNAGSDVVNVTASNMSEFNGMFTGTDMTFAGGTGLNLLGQTGSTINVGLQNVQLGNAGVNAINAQATGGATTSVTGDVVSAGNAGGDTVVVVGDGGNASVVITNAGSFTSTGGSPINFLADNGGDVVINLDGNGPVVLDGATGDAIVGIARNNSTATLNLNDFSANMASGYGLNLTAENDSTITGMASNGSFNSNGMGGINLSTNPDMSAADASYIAMVFDTVSASMNFGNGVTLNAANGDDAFPNPQLTGVAVQFDNGQINNNSNMNLGDGIGYGISALADGDGGVPGNTQISIFLNGTDVVGNEEGPLDLTQQDGGFITFSAMGGMIDIGTDPLQFCVDGVGDIMNITLDGVTVASNASGAGLSIVARNGGQFTGNFANLNFSGNAGTGVDILAELDGDINLGLTNVGIMNNGTMVDPKTGLPVTGAFQATIRDVGSTLTLDMDGVNIANNPVKAFDVNVESGGALFASMTVVNSTFSPNIPVAGEGEFDISVDGAGSVGTITTNGMMINNSLANAIRLSATDGGALSANLNQIFAENAAEDTVRAISDGMGSSLLLGLNEMMATGAAESVLDLDVTGGATANVVAFNNVTGDMAGSSAVDIDVAAGSTLTSFVARNGNYDNAGAMPIDIRLGGQTMPTTISLTAVRADNAPGNAVNIDLTGLTGGGTSTVLIDRVMATGGTGAGLDLEVVGLDGTINTTILDSNFSNAGNDGVDMSFDGVAGSMANLNVNGLNVSDSGGNGVLVDFEGLITGAVNSFDNVDASGNAAGAGVAFRSVGGLSTITTVNANGVDATGAGTDGVFVMVGPQAVPIDVSLQNVDASNAGQDGVDIDLISVTGGTSNVTLSNIDATGVGDRAIELLGFMAGATDVLNVTIDGGADVSDLSNAGAEAIDLDLRGAVGAMANVDISDVTANMAGAGAIDIRFLDGITGAVTNLDSVTATDAAGTGLRVMSDVASTLSTVNASNSDFSRAGGNGVTILSDTQMTGVDINLTDVTADDAAFTGVDIELRDTAGTSNVVLDGVVATGAMSGMGLDFDASLLMMGDIVNVDVLGTSRASDFSGASSDAVDIRVAGPGTATVSLDNVVASDAMDRGVDLTFEGGVTATVDTFNNVVAQGNEEEGLNIDVKTGSTLTTFTADGLDLSNNTTNSMTAAALRVNVRDGSMADFDLTNLTINNTVPSFGQGVQLNVQNSSTLNFDVTTGLIANNGREGVDISVGTITPGSTFVGNFTGLDILNNGNAPTVFADGFHAEVVGMGSNATINLDDVSSDGNTTGDGYDFFADLAAVLDVTINNGSTGSNNGGRGLALLAEGSDTMVSLMSVTGMGQPANTFNDNGTLGSPLNNGGHGVEIVLQNGGVPPLVGDFDLTASANNNQGDGIRFIANDGSGVQIDNLGITAANVNVDNNMGNGLTIDLNAVLGLMDFDLSNLTVNDNEGDQINVTLTDMTLGTVSFDNVVADGPGAMAGMGDGLELTLDGTTVTTALNLDNVTGINNGEDGLQLNLLNMASIPMGSAIDIGTFDNNGQHGINITVDDSTAELSVTNSGVGLGMVASASNNGVDGLHVEVENGGSLTMPSVDNIEFINNGASGVMIHTNDSGFFSGGSITNNTITDNGSFGIRAIFEGTNAIGSDFDLSIGSNTMPGNGNLIDNNVGAGIAVDLLQHAEGFLRIVDNTITDTQNDAMPATPFAGEGIYVRMIGNVIDPMQAINVLDDLVIRDNTIGGPGNGNAGHGVALDFQERSVANNVDILDNVLSDNGLDGINIFRRDEVVMNSVDINDNMIERNGDDGLDIIAQNDDNDLINVSVNRNRIVMNNDDGVFAQTGADAQMDLDMTLNTIEDNGGDGIHIQQNALTPTDLRSSSAVPGPATPSSGTTTTASVSRR